ncbi:MAG: Linearmycin resistance ATP-binding protein LnrL [Chlamydiae bacterium]|nr:Linearmycin resistance ATP-binding protein LnrL [Chlamydiota bacterium]
MTDSFITVEQIKKVFKTKRRPDKEALKGVSFDILKGEVLGLLGVNGAGKTTLSSILASLTPASSGDVLWQGRSIYSQLNAYRRIVGFCPQKPNLDQILTLDQNLLFAGRFYGMSDKEARMKKDQFIEQFALEGYKDSLASTLSGGYKQRFLIARSLIHSPQLVILDEPTVGLDAHIRHELWKVINDLKKDGVTIILTTHYLEEAEALVDRVCMLDHGEVHAIGTLSQVMKNYDKDKLEDVLLAIQKKES